jgi:hypothetical protein
MSDFAIEDRVSRTIVSWVVPVLAVPGLLAELGVFDAPLRAPWWRTWMLAATGVRSVGP